MLKFSISCRGNDICQIAFICFFLLILFPFVLLIGGILVSTESVKATGSDETPESLWGEEKTDPKDALESNGFQMRKVALHAVPGRRGRGRGRGKFHGNKNGKKQANGGATGGGETAPAATESTTA